MPNFTTETDVREKLQLTDAVQAPDTLLTRSIDDAHTQILRYIEPDYITDPPHPELALAETLLAGANALRSLATAAAHRRKHITIGGNRIQPADRDITLNGLADAIESQAWDMLEPFLRRMPPRRVLRLTATQPILGED